MKEMPEIRSMNRITGAPLGSKHTVVLFDKVKVIGRAQCAYLVIVYSNRAREPVYIVASEINASAQSQGGSHSVVVFDGHRRMNHGASDDWSDARKFFAEALRIAAEAFAVTAPKV